MRPLLRRIRALAFCLLSIVATSACSESSTSPLKASKLPHMTLRPFADYAEELETSAGGTAGVTTRILSNWAHAGTFDLWNWVATTVTCVPTSLCVGATAQVDTDDAVWERGSAGGYFSLHNDDTEAQGGVIAHDAWGTWSTCLIGEYNYDGNRPDFGASGVPFHRVCALESSVPGVSHTGHGVTYAIV
jgi:hypothetical protein